MFYSTWQHIRYEYYLAINIALLSAVCVSFVISCSETEIHRLISGFSSRQSPADTNSAEKPPSGKSKRRHAKKPAPSKSPGNTIALLVLSVTIILALLFVYDSASLNYSASADGSVLLDPDWKESLEWLGNNTPDTGLDYYAIYDQNAFSYPNTSYGIMSWWDYGHMITYLAKRIPNANPFQQGVAGKNGAAAFFVTTSEETANGILDADGTRYVVTDYMMDWSKFLAMATWYNSSAAYEPFMIELLVPEQNSPSNIATRIILNKPLYYQTMISRLHNYDGSMTPAAPASYYVEYVDPSVSGITLPVVTKAVVVNMSEGANQVSEYNRKNLAGHHAILLSSSLARPMGDVPALRHYRLIHESPFNMPGFDSEALKKVKIFEYVDGAHIRGTGIIEVPLVTNTGRKFVYRQESTGGEFIVPYSTTGNTYGVKALGKYRIVGTGREYDVPEAAVLQGLAIAG
jgi:dolichyl-diphosphooligosaccharide--protein glycosyltransferase